MPTSLVASLMPSDVLPAGLSFWEITPITTAAWSWRRRSIGSPSLWADVQETEKQESAQSTSASLMPSRSMRSSKLRRRMDRYVRGVCWSLAQWRGPITAGFAATILGDVPLGAGLSSSASLQASLAWFAIQIGLVLGRSARNRAPDRVDLSLMELAQVLRRSENEFVGVGSGARSVRQPLRPRRSCVVPRLRQFAHERVPLGSPAPRSWSATPKRRAGWRMACITGDGQSAIESRRISS